MSRYQISFGDGSKDHIPVAETLLVAEAVHAVLSDARAAGGLNILRGALPPAIKHRFAGR